MAPSGKDLDLAELVKKAEIFSKKEHADERKSRLARDETRERHELWRETIAFTLFSVFLTVAFAGCVFLVATPGASQRKNGLERFSYRS